MDRKYNDVSSAFGAIEVDISGGDQVLAPGCRGLYIGTSGDVVIDLPSNSSVTFVGVPAGIFPVQVSRVHQTGTTAANIVALY